VNDHLRAAVPQLRVIVLNERTRTPNSSETVRTWYSKLPVETSRVPSPKLNGHVTCSQEQRDPHHGEHQQHREEKQDQKQLPLKRRKSCFACSTRGFATEWREARQDAGLVALAVTMDPAGCPPCSIGTRAAK